MFNQLERNPIRSFSSSKVDTRKYSKVNSEVTFQYFRQSPIFVTVFDGFKQI